MADPATIDALAKDIAGIESQGQPDPYKALGPAQPSGDRAHGKYQIMGSNIGPWAKEAGLGDLTPDAFLADPDAQEKVARFKLGQYYDQYGNPGDVASMWHSGVPLAQAKAEGRKDSLGTTTADYASRVGGEASAATPAPPAGEDVKVRLPDGTTVNLGANPSPELREQVKQKILSRWPELDPNASRSTQTTPTTMSVGQAVEQARETTPEEAGKTFNRQLGLGETNPIGKYTAAIGKPAMDAAIDLIKGAANITHPEGFADAATRIAEVLHPLAAIPEAAGNVAWQGATDAGASPDVAAGLATAVNLLVGAKTPVPGAGETPPRLTSPLQGTKATRAAAQEAAQAAERGEAWATAAATEGKAATEAAAREAADVTAAAGARAQEARQASEAATGAAESAAARVAPSTAVAEEGRAALTPAEVTTAQGGQAARAGLGKQLAEVKEPTQGIYNAYIAEHGHESLDPAKYKGIAEQIDELRAAGRLKGDAGKTIEDISQRLNAGQKITVGDLDDYKMALDDVLPGGPKPGLSLKERDLYDFKFQIRDWIRESATGDEREWLEAADSMWRDVIIGKGKPRALGNLVKLVERDPETAVQRLFGEGTSDKQAEMAKTVMKALDSDSTGTAEAVRQSVLGRLLRPDAEGRVDPADALARFDRWHKDFREAFSNPGAESFFKVLRQQQDEAARTAAAAKTATGAAKEAAKESTKAAKGAQAKAGEVAAAAEREATTAKRVAERGRETAGRAAKIAERPNKLATFMANGLHFSLIGAPLEMVSSGLGMPGLGTVAAFTGVGKNLIIPTKDIAKFLANPKLATLMARAMKTPANSAVVPAIMRQLFLDKQVQGLLNAPEGQQKMEEARQMLAGGEK